MNKIESTEDLNQLINSRPIIVLTAFRGNWCPFCKQYLKSFNKALNAHGKASSDALGFYAVSVDSVNKNEALKKKLSVDFNFVSDPSLVLRDQYDNPFSSTHLMAKTTANGAFLQPAVYIFKDGKLDFSWQQTPKLRNMGGATNRIDVEEVVQRINALV